MDIMRVDYASNTAGGEGMSIFEETIKARLLARIGKSCPDCGGTHLMVMWQEPKFTCINGAFGSVSDEMAGYVARCTNGHVTFICRGDERA